MALLRMHIVSVSICLKWIYATQPPWWILVLCFLAPATLFWIFPPQSSLKKLHSVCAIALCAHVAHSMSIPQQWKTLVSAVTIVSGLSSAGIPLSKNSGVIAIILTLVAFIGIIISITFSSGLALVDPAIEAWEWLGLVTACVWHISCGFYTSERNVFDMFWVIASAVIMTILSAYPDATGRLWHQSTWWILLAHPSIAYTVRQITAGYAFLIFLF